MHKLVILIEVSQEWITSEDHWPEFLHLIEEMPGLRREAISRVEQGIFGISYVQMHELFFDTLKEAQGAMASPKGRQAGRLLQQMTGGRMTLFFAEHKEDDIENIRKFTQLEHPSE
jgi:uncharacterized protein (TIGR02118 family)